MKCIDVERKFPKYKTGYEDPSYAGTQDPWNKIVICRFGHICPSGGNTLWAFVKNGAASRRALSTLVLSGLGWSKTVGDLKQYGTDGIAFEFDAKDWKVFFNLLGAKKR